MEANELERLIEAGNIDKLVDAFYLLCRNLGGKYGKRDDDDAVQEAVLDCWRGSKSFKLGRVKAFTYFTTIARNCFYRGWKRQQGKPVMFTNAEFDHIAA